MAGREGWKTAGRVEKAEQTRERAHSHTHSDRSRNHKASDGSGHYSWEACWELRRLALDTAWDRKPESGYCVAWSLLRVGDGSCPTAPSFSDAHLGCVGSSAHIVTHKAADAGWKPIFKEGTGRG